MTTLFLLHILLIGQVPLTLAFLSSLPECANSPGEGVFDTSSCASYTDTNLALQCVCSNTGLLSDAAAAIYNQCGCTDLETSAQVVVQDCTTLGTPSALSESDFIQAGCGSTTCGSSSSSGLSTGDIVGIVSGAIAAIALIVACLQLAASLKVIPEDKAPSRYLKQVLCCSCCSGGYSRTKVVGREKSQPVTPQDWHPAYQQVGNGPLAYQQVPHQDIPTSYDSQWGVNMSTIIR
jgi:hypothetical protein